MKLAVIGAGSFGTALASSLTMTGQQVLLYGRSRSTCVEINTHHTNANYFQDHAIPEKVIATNNPDELLQCDALVLAVPSAAMPDVVAMLKAISIGSDCVLINTAKGLTSNGSTICDQLQSEFPSQRIGSLKGPTFSKPLMARRKSAMTLALSDERFRQQLIDTFSHPRLELEPWPSAADVEVVSALKNIVAIMLGICDALEMSSNTRYLLLTKIFRFCQGLLSDLGLNPEVILTYAGIGDILLTSLEDASRNRTLGLLIGKGFDFDSLRAGPVTEGVRAALIFRQLTMERGQNIPLLESLCSLLTGKTSLSDFYNFIHEEW